MSKKILLLTLETFCATGGIQKMGRILAYGLQQLGAKHKWEAELYSLCDRKTDLMPEYLAEEKFKAFRKNRLKFMWESIKAGKKADLVILSHINLSVLGWAIYLLNPNCQIWLIAHDFEAFRLNVISGHYSPRDYILENLSLKKSAEQMLNIINTVNQ